MNTGKQTSSKDYLSFEVNSIEWLRINQEWPMKASQHPCFQIVWITKGMGYYCIDMEKYLLSGNTLLFVPPGRMQQLPPSQEISGWMLSFHPDFLSLSASGASMNLYKEMVVRFSKVIVLDLKDDKIEYLLTNVLKEIIRESGEQQSLRTEAISGLLHIFLIYLQRLAAPVQHEASPKKQVDLFNSFYSRLERDFLTKRQVAEYASELSVTPSYLSDVVKRVSGYSASYHIQQRMVLEAKRLAMYSDANMKLIAYKLGFDDLSHFSKFFKNVAGVNFSDFRNHTPGINRTTDAGIGQLLQPAV